MKKSLMILASVALGASMAVGQDVESKNVVGFTTVTLPVNLYTPVGWQFGLVGGSSNVLIASITNYPGEKKGATSGASDWIRRFDSVSSTWVDYYNRTTGGWRKGAEVTTTTDSIMVGEMVMFYKRTTNSVGFPQSGEVLGGNVTISLPLNLYSPICNPFPVELEIASITNYPGEKKGATSGASDWIRRFDSVSSSWVDYYNRTTGGWRKGAETTTTTDLINIGEGFMFYKRTQSGSIVFASPI